MGASNAQQLRERAQQLANGNGNSSALPAPPRVGRLTFQKASKRQAKLRLAIDGPSGGGKTWTSLSIASRLGKRIAVVDTERGSASLYSDTFDFDVIELAPPFEPHIAVEAIKAAVDADYEVLIIDSLSHFWDGEGGVLEMVDNAAARARGNKFAGWRVGTPAYQNLIDTILGADLHVICTMRSKTEWVVEENTKGKSEPKRIGTSPVMRGGIEYEFTLVADLDLEHRATITKSRCAEVADKVYPAHREGDLAETLKGWLESGVAPASAEDRSALVAQLNTIAHPDARAQAKRSFIATFGTPDFLTADKVEAAKAWVAEQLKNANTEKGSGGDAEAPSGDASTTGDGADSHDVGSSSAEPLPETEWDDPDRAMP